ncbi:outer membrane beta-barrel protein [Spirosoma validum]|uniref:Outer membrane beta-barrel protein n=1 Tax=Spirosoma validum TaxID=2771355 RepID=A0A927B312_9BACT|nr:outer membrane beta-barrel protein [Spirosoma validum]MBD2754670.1 outer membrane beta-barrel protein [Spirosoma validum]
MKTIARIVALIVGLATTTAIQAKPVSPTDSLVIRFANRTRLVIYAPDKAGIQALSNYDLNKIVREMGMKLDSVAGGQTAISQGGDRFLKDTVLVVTKKKDGVTIVINDKGDTTQTLSRRRDQGDRDYDRARRQKRDRDRGSIDYGISFGLNNFVQQSSNPAYPEDNYDLRPIGSRYFALSVGAMPTISRGKYASLKLYYGVEVAWNNFMFEGNNVAEKTPAGVAFPDAGRELQKSKLTVCTIGIPVVPRVTFYNTEGRKICHIGLGGYVNYRLDSYRKIKEADGGTDRRHSDYYLNNYRYGLMAHLGLRSIDFFVKYDLKPLFQTDKGPDVRTLSFGIGF